MKKYLIFAYGFLAGWTSAFIIVIVLESCDTPQVKEQKQFPPYHEATV